MMTGTKSISGMSTPWYIRLTSYYLFQAAVMTGSSGPSSSLVPISIGYSVKVERHGQLQ